MNAYAMTIKKPDNDNSRAKSAGHTSKLPPISINRHHTQSEINIKELEQKHAQSLRVVQDIKDELGFE